MTATRVLCLNAGSSSLKFALYELDGARETLAASGDVSRIGERDARLRVSGPGTAGNTDERLAATDHAAAVHAAFAALDARKLAPPDAVGHRIVHGGPDLIAPTRIDDDVLARLRRAVPFAPLHLPAEIAGIETARKRVPDAPQVACFDTSFHRTMPEIAQRFPLPRPVVERGLHRYGFHGLSYEYVVGHVGAHVLGRAVIAHLGNGASLAAIRDGVSLETTMGFSPTAGVMMGTRSGDLDPGLVIHLLTHAGYDAQSLERLVNRDAGLLGVSGTTADMQSLLERRERDPEAALAVGMFCYQVRKAVGALAAVLDGIDTLVFTGGIGEHAPAVRAEICAGLGHLGIALDASTNAQGADVVSASGSRTAVRVVRTDEERMIARHVLRTLAPLA